MQCDEVVWQVINQGQCAFRVKTVEQNFCRNENNVTGLCNRQSCPLANSRYATIREVEGKCFLFMKTIERSFSPARMWEKIKLSSDYAVALQQLDEHLQYWPKYLVHKAKQRLTKITQYLVRMRKLKLKPKMKLVGITKKTEKREARREEKAEKAAKIENSIESALLERLKKGTYGDIYNFPVEEYNKALDEEERLADEMELEEEQDGNVEFVEDFSDLDEDDLEDYDIPGVADFASDLDEDDDEDDEEEDDEEADASDDGVAPPPASTKGKGSLRPKAAPKLPPKKGGRTRVEIEYETETSGTANVNYDQ